MRTVTTSVDRIRSAGYWCSEADRETSELLSKLGKQPGDEIPVRDILDTLGLSVGLIALGAAHPRYEIHAHTLALRYGRALFRHIGTALADIDKPASLNRELIAYGVQSRETLREDLRKRWKHEKYISADPQHKYLCNAVYIMMTEHPLHIRLVHAGKEYLEAAPSLALVHLTADLRRMLNEPL